MIPSWIREQLSFSWFERSTWMPYRLNQSGSQYTCRTGDNSFVRIDIQRFEEDGRLEVTTHRVKVNISPNNENRMSGFQLRIPVASSLKCTWKPHLSPVQGMTVGDDAFRSPVIILEDRESVAALVPDLNCFSKRVIPHVMDYEVDGHLLTYGLSDYEKTGHVYYQLAPESHIVKDPVSFQFYLLQWEKKRNVWRDFRPVEQYLWLKFASDKNRLGKISETDVKALQKYVLYTYDWAFNRWKDVCWQQFTLDGEEVGGVVFITTANQKPGLGNEEGWREPKSIWNQAWFCSLRSAYGYALWGKRLGNSDWQKKAEKALNFALSAPQTNGLFPGCYRADDRGGWADGRWIMSPPRRPERHEDYCHLLDASWTCYWLLKWYRDVRKDVRIVPYVKNYVQRLLSLQQPEGNFPAWVRAQDLKLSPYLMESPETAMHIMLLCHLYEIDRDPSYLEAAKRAVKFLQGEIILQGRWEDFETYWSCSLQWEGKQFGMRDARSGLYNQCNFGIYWTGEALKDLYKITADTRYLDLGETVLAELSLYQQIWEPPFMPVPTLGGFGVMNSDNEWNDARQSLFALTYLDYYSLTGNKTYRNRGLWAMKASFYMMYCPENAEVRKLYEKVYPFFDELDFGFNMENFNHGDGNDGEIGEFTIFDWGNGAAAASLAEIMCKGLVTEKQLDQRFLGPYS